MRQIAPLFRISGSRPDRILNHLALQMAISPPNEPRKGTMYIVDGTLVPTRDRSISASSKNYRNWTNLRIVIDANASGVDRSCRGAPIIADGEANDT